MVYNCKVLFYADNCQQVRLYSSNIHKKDKYTELLNEKRQRIKDIKKENNISSDSEWSEYVSQNRTIKSIYNIARSNHWDWFITFTADKRRVNRYDYNDVVSNCRKYLEFIKKNYSPDLKYIIVPEKHKDGAYHMHGLLSNVNNELFKPKIENNELQYDKHGRQIFITPSYIFGITEATKTSDSFASVSYITKYINKDLCIDTKNQPRYYVSRNVKRAEELELRLNDEQIEQLLDLNAKNMLFAKTVEFQDENNITYIEMKNINTQFEFKKGDIDV